MTSGGYINGQEFIVLLLVTAQITILVGFAFYQPDPVYSKWKKPDKKLKPTKIPKKNRPVAPPKNKNYPTKLEIALNLLEDFKHCHPTFKVKVRFSGHAPIFIALEKLPVSIVAPQIGN